MADVNSSRPFLNCGPSNKSLEEYISTPKLVFSSLGTFGGENTRCALVCWCAHTPQETAVLLWGVPKFFPSSIFGKIKGEEGASCHFK